MNVFCFLNSFSMTSFVLGPPPSVNMEKMELKTPVMTLKGGGVNTAILPTTSRMPSVTLRGSIDPSGLLAEVNFPGRNT